MLFRSSKILVAEEPQTPLSMTISTPTPPSSPPLLIVSKEERDDREDDMDEEARQVKAAFDAACIESQSLGSDSPNDDEDDYWPGDDDDIDDDAEEGNEKEGPQVKLDSQLIVETRSTSVHFDHTSGEHEAHIIPSSYFTQKLDGEPDLNSREEGKEVDDASIPIRQGPNYSRNSRQPAVIASNSCKCTVS